MLSIHVISSVHHEIRISKYYTKGDELQYKYNKMQLDNGIFGYCFIHEADIYSLKILI